MTDGAVADALAQYRAGLEAEIAVLHQLEAVAVRQRGVTENRDLDRFAVESDERDRLMRALLALEEGLRPVRDQLHQHQRIAVHLPGYDAVAALRHTAASLVSAILATDRQSLKALADAELARRTAAANLEQGETTLAAYRRVLSPALAHASLVDRRG